MAQSRPLAVGWDGPKESIAGAYIAQAHHAEIVSCGTIGTRPCASERRIRRRHSQSPPRVFGYEAGPCGSWLSRYLTKNGQVCCVVAPSLLPTKPGERVTTNRRDAIQLARLRRAGDRTPVYVPQVADDAMRALGRAREDAIHDCKAATFRLKAFLLRQASRSTGRATGGPAHRRWLSEVVCPPPAQQRVFQDYVRAVTDHPERLQRLEQELTDQGQTWRLAPGVDALQALRGVPFPVAVTTGAARGDLTRFEPPRQLMSSLGLPPSAYATGERRPQGGITTAGNTQARRTRIEGAWASRSPAKVRRPLPLRLEKGPKPSQALSWKAQGRLGKRYRQLIARGQHANQVAVAIARELRAFMWAIAQEVSLTP